MTTPRSEIARLERRCVVLQKRVMRAKDALAQVRDLLRQARRVVKPVVRSQDDISREAHARYARIEMAFKGGATKSGVARQFGVSLNTVNHALFRCYQLRLLAEKRAEKQRWIDDYERDHPEAAL